MPSFVAFSFWCIFSVSITGQAKQATVNVTNDVSGITIFENSGSVQTTPTEWKVTFLSQQGYDLLFKLNNEWGFDPINPSNITLILNGINYNNAEGDLLLVFSVSNSQYFAVVIRNEISSQLYKVYPQPFASSLPQINVESMISRKTPDRWDRIIRNKTWYNTIPIYKNPSGFAAEWPIKISILNDPIGNTVRYSHIDTNTNDELYSVTYLQSFPNNDGLDVYIMSDGSAESFGIYSITIKYHIHQVHTEHPTLTPSIPPTTAFPSNTPTHSPTTQPTHSPSTQPIHSPSTQPTHSPTHALTEIPRPSLLYINASEEYLVSVLEATETWQTIGTNDDTNIILSDVEGDTNYVVLSSNYKDVAIVSLLAACIGSIFCICTLVLLYCCIQSHIYQRRRQAKPCRSQLAHSVQYHVPKMNQCGVRSNTIPDHQSYDYRSNTIPMDGRNDGTSSISINRESDVCDEEKEGELVTVNGVGIDMNELMQYDTHSKMSSNDSRVRHVVHDVNVHTINYDKMIRYLNDDEMSSSSHENNLEEVRTLMM